MQNEKHEKQEVSWKPKDYRNKKRRIFEIILFLSSGAILGFFGSESRELNTSFFAIAAMTIMLINIVILLRTSEMLHAVAQLRKETQ